MRITYEQGNFFKDQNGLIDLGIYYVETAAVICGAFDDSVLTGRRCR